MLIQKAWLARQYALPTKTKVGCAVQIEDGSIYTGQNFAGNFGTSLHAELSAITKTIPFKQNIVAVAIVSETEQFTPCGACMDWLMQFCSQDCKITIANRSAEQVFSLNELMPFYPKY